MLRTPDTDVESFGPWLRRQREVRGIDQREVADSSKISVRYIEALETNRFEVLPAEVFTKGFLRQYAVYVGLDPEEVVNYYLAALQARRDQEEPDDELGPKARPQSGSGWIWLVVLFAAALIAVWWWQQRSVDPGAEDGQTAGRDSVSDSAPAPEPTAPAASAYGTADSGSSGPGTTGPESTADDGAPDASAEPASAEPAVDETPAPTPPPSRPPPEVPTDGSLVVVADFSGDCWVEAAMDDSRRLEQMRVQGESLRLEADSTIDLKLGNAAVVTVEVNGLPLPLRPPANSSVVNLRIDAAMVAALRAGAAGVE